MVKNFDGINGMNGMGFEEADEVLGFDPSCECEF
jgi:hypothetical protein